MNYQEFTIIGSLFIFGLLGGFSHCTGMCGPFVLNQVGNRLKTVSLNDSTFIKLRGIALLPYHFGRITTYCVITFISSLFFNNLKNIFFFKQIVGVFLIIAALIFFNSTIAKIKLPFKLHAKSQDSQILARFKSLITCFGNINFRKLIDFLFLNPIGFKSYFLGIILGFIPCGLVYGAIATSLSLGNTVKSVIAVFVFGIGTIPALFFTACGGFWFFNKNKKYLNVFVKFILFINIITLLIMAFGLMSNRI